MLLYSEYSLKSNSSSPINLDIESVVNINLSTHCIEWMTDVITFGTAVMYRETNKNRFIYQIEFPFKMNDKFCYLFLQYLFFLSLFLGSKSHLGSVRIFTWNLLRDQSPSLSLVYTRDFQL